MGKNQAVEKAEYFAESIGRMAYQALLEEVYTVPKPGLVDPYSCGAHTDMDVQTFERSAEALYPWFVRMAYQGYQLTCTPEDLFREIRKTGMLAELEDGLLRGMEWNRIKLQILFALMSRVQDSNILSRKNPSVLYQVQMEAMQFLEEGGAYSEDALDKLIRMDADYIKRGISAGGCADLLATSLFLAMLCNKIPNENGAILNLFPVVK